MPYQFNCPNGHLLEALETQAGDQCNCPHCGVLMVIPQQPPGTAAPPQSAEAFPDVSQQTPDVTQASSFEPNPEEEDLLHIPCPNGHVLDTPRDMIGQAVMCPHCDAEFRLRESDSEEYQRRKKAAQERRERKAGNLWLNWSIVIAVIVLLGLGILIFLSSASK